MRFLMHSLAYLLIVIPITVGVCFFIVLGILIFMVSSIIMYPFKQFNKWRYPNGEQRLLPERTH